MSRGGANLISTTPFGLTHRGAEAGSSAATVDPRQEDRPTAVKRRMEVTPLTTKAFPSLAAVLMIGLGFGTAAGLAAPAAPQGHSTPPQLVPTRYDQDRFLAAPVTASGQRLALFADTGGALFIAQGTVKRLGLTEHKLHIDGQDVQAAALPPLDPRASIPLVLLTDGLLPVAPPDNGPGAFIYRSLDGLLGQAWFQGRVWTFDYPGRRLLLRAPGDLPSHAPQHAVRLGFLTNMAGVRQGNYPRVQASVAGRTLDLLLDTGATTDLTPAALRQVHDGRPAIRATSFVVAGVFDRWHAQHPEWRVIAQAEGGVGQAMMEVPHVTVAGYTVGPVWFTRRPDAAFHDFMSQYMDKRIDGSLGGNALRHFRVTLDYPGAVAVFEEPTVHASEQGAAPPVRDESLRAELLAMLKRDQAVRQRSIERPKDSVINSEMAAIDARDTARMKQIVAQRGWPSERLVGADGAGAAFLLVQHADADPTFQARCLPLLQAAAQRGEASKQDVAVLTDRVLLAQGKEQVYGSQFTWKTGKVEPRPLEDPAHVDGRRKAMGLMPLAEYRQMLIKLYRLQGKE